MKNSVQVSILGQQFTFRSEASEAEVARVVELVNDKIAEVTAPGRIADTLNVAILALLNLAGSFVRLQEERVGAASGANDPEADFRLLQLLERLEKACPETAESSNGTSR